MDDSYLKRASLLLQQGRSSLAETELRRGLLEDPSQPLAHALLAICQLNNQQYPEATQEAQTAIHLAPDHDFGHATLARILFARNHFPEAEAAVRQAIAIQSFNADHQALLGQIRYARRDWQAALHAADAGLAIDAENTDCANLRASCLVNLGRQSDAVQTIQATLERNPDDANSHANLGWALIEQSQYERALEHFREALRLDPNLEWARMGIIEAMKAHYLVYRVMLRYFLAMMKLSRQVQWGIMLGGYFGYQFLRQLAANNPGLAPVIWPLMGLYIAFAILTWLAQPMFDLMLRLNRFGRLALSREQIITSNWIGLCLAGGILSLVAFVIWRADWQLVLTIVWAAMMLPLSSIYNCESGWPRITMILSTIGVGLIGLAATAMLFIGGSLGAGGQVLSNLGGGVFTGFCYSIVLMQFVSVVMSQARPRR